VARHLFIAGFEPFGGDKISPSEMVARSFEGRLIAGRSVAVCVLPVETSAPSMSLELMKRGIEILVETVVPWVEQRTPEASRAREKGKSMWIPRGVKEVER
jgi:pyrrolidone-carboxylate peptidase